MKVQGLKAILLLTLCTSSGLAFAQDHAELTNLKLTVAARQKEEGKIAKTLHQFTLDCFQGRCSLEVISFNQCQMNSFTGVEDSIIKVERWGDNELRVTPSESSSEAKSIVVELSPFVAGGRASIKLRFDYTRLEPKGASKITNFTGGYTKDSEILKRVVVVEYIPLRGQMSSIRLDCAILLNGIEKK